MNDYGSGHSGAIIVAQNGPVPPPPEAIEVAAAILAGKMGVPPPCLDCAPNLIVEDHRCEHGHWEWALLVAHDDTCPMNNGKLTRNNDSETS